jgi:hypothetical protein
MYSVYTPGRFCPIYVLLTKICFLSRFTHVAERVVFLAFFFRTSQTLNLHGTRNKDRKDEYHFRNSSICNAPSPAVCERRWMEMDGGRWRWMEVDGNRWRWMEMYLQGLNSMILMVKDPKIRPNCN